MPGRVVLSYQERSIQRGLISSVDRCLGVVLDRLRKALDDVDDCYSIRKGNFIDRRLLDFIKLSTTRVILIFD